MSALESPRPSGAHGQGLIARFAFLGAGLGLVAGAYEAALLYFSPRQPLLQSDVTFAIWFLAPLVDFLVFTLVGLCLGQVASLGGRVVPWRVATAGATGLGLVGAYVYALSTKSFFHLPFRLDRLDSLLPKIAIWFFVVLICAFTAINLMWGRVAGFFRVESAGQVGGSVKGLFGAVAFLILGLGIYGLRQAATPSLNRPAPPQATRKPNIVLITLDTLRADHLSVYGYPSRTTPNLDRLAARGMLFENAVAATSWTLPSHASMFTELLPHQHGADFSIPLDAGPWTLPEILKADGYETVGFSSNIYYGLAGWGLGRGFEAYEDYSSSVIHNLVATVVGRSLQRFCRELIHTRRFDLRDGRDVTGDVARWFQHRSNRPFFLFLNYIDLHDPVVSVHFRRQNTRLSDALMQRWKSVAVGPHPAPVPERLRKAISLAYDERLSYLDEQVSGLLQNLSNSPEWANTFVIITADHGEGLGEHGAYGHGSTLYREVLHVPLILLGPGIPPGGRVREIVELREIFSTVLDFALAGRLPFRSHSLRRFWIPQPLRETSDRYVISELIQAPWLPNHKSVISSMTSEWHYLRDSQGREELYHWLTDPKETDNLRDLPQYEGLLRELRDRLYREVALSLGPWRGPDYLVVLGEPRRFLWPEAAFGLAGSSPVSVTPGRRIGSAQAFFPLRPTERADIVADHDMIRSLPYE